MITAVPKIMVHVWSRCNGYVWFLYKIYVCKHNPDIRVTTVTEMIRAFISILLTIVEKKTSEFVMVRGTKTGYDVVHLKIWYIAAWKPDC